MNSGMMDSFTDYLYSFTCLNHLIHQKPIDRIKLEQLLNEYTFNPQTLFDAARNAIFNGELGLHVLFDKVDPDDILRLVVYTNLKGDELQRSIQHQLDRGATLHAQYMRVTIEKHDLQTYKWMLQIASVDVLHHTLGIVDMNREPVGFVLPLVNTYLHKSVSPMRTTIVSIELQRQRSYRALIRYVHSFHQRQTLFMFAALARRNPKAKLPLDLVKNLAEMVLGPIRPATQQEIEDEGWFRREEEHGHFEEEDDWSNSDED